MDLLLPAAILRARKRHLTCWYLRETTYTHLNPFYLPPQLESHYTYIL